MHRFLEDVRRGKARVAKLLALSGAAIGMGVAFPFAVDFAVAKAPLLAPILKAEGNHLDAKAVLFPVAMFGITICCMILEAWLLGYGRSTLRNVIVNEVASVRTDIFFFLFRISGLMVIFSLLFSLGGLYVVADYIEAKIGFALMRDVDSIALQFLSIVVAFSFVNYWLHRLLHSPVLWEIHKVHHSAEDLNVLLPYRNHPVDFVLATFQGAVVTAVLGVRPEATVLWLALNSVYQSFVHSRYDWKWRWLEYILITPAAHRIHHSTAVEHYTRNLGILSIWDRLFGTYLRPSAATLHYGVPDRENFNTDRYFTEIMECLWRWIGVRRAAGDRTA